MPRLIILNKPYCDEEALPNVVNYVLGRSLCGGMAVDPEYAVEQMLLVKRLWYKTAAGRSAILFCPSRSMRL